MKKAIIINFFAALFASASLCAGDPAPINCQNMAIETDAGLIHFEFVKQSQALPGLFQGVAGIDANNNSFELSNGSKWSAHAIEMIRGWVAGDQLVLSQNQAFFSPYRFALVNLRLGKATPISLSREPRATAEDSFYISKVDYANDIVVLNKGGLQWEVYRPDHGTLRKFSEHDRILLGVNTASYADEENHMHYILINTATNQYVRAKPISR